MAFVLSLITLWIVGLFLVLYYWCAENSKTGQADNPVHRNISLCINSNDKCKKLSTSSIESSGVSEEEFSSTSTKKRLKRQAKTRWPSKTSFSSTYN